VASCPAPPLCQHQWAVAGLFWRLDLISFTIFAHVSLLHLIIFSISYFLCHDGKGEHSAHRLSLASRSHCSLANINGQRKVFLRVRFDFLHLFCSCFLLHLLFILIKYSLFRHGNGGNSVHRLSLVPCSNYCLAITKKQQWVYFEGKFS
jgi:hypothetical protein